MKKAGIIGLGLIGGSIAKALRNKAGFKTVNAFDTNTASLREAIKDGVIDESSTEGLTIFSDCDIVFICSPVTIIPDFLDKLSGIIKSSCIVTDVGSVKKNVIEKADELEGMQFIGGHPMAGSEKTGYEASNDFMLENAYYLLIPSKHTKPETVEAFKALLCKILAIPVVMNASEHDRITAVISHAPHMIASAIVNMARRLDDNSEAMRDLAAGGFKDITRIASSDSKLWQSIANENRQEVLKALDIFSAELEEVKKYLREDNETELGGYLRLAKNYRDSLPASSRAKYIKTYEITADIEDKPGSIAIVATLLGVNGVNIKNIGIMNSREYEGGVLKISFGSEDDMKNGAQLLKAMKFNIYGDI